MHLRILLILLIIHSCASAQTDTLYGKVRDTAGNHLPYALVFPAEEPSRGTYADEHGYFSLILERGKEYEIVAKSVGYGEYKFNYRFQTDSLSISMVRETNIMRGVTISASKGKAQIGVLGKKNIKNHVGGGRFNGRTYNQYGDEQAIWLAADNGSGILKEVFFFVTHYGQPTSKFRIHVYSLDAGALAPGKELTDSNIIVHATRGDRWVSADLSSLNIIVRRGVFLSVEWIDEHGNDPQPWSDSRTTASNAQVMGLTDDYWRSGNITYQRKVYEDTWVQNNTMFAYRKNTLNLQAYATYYYYR